MKIIGSKIEELTMADLDWQKDRASTAPIG